jgi:hypothetical protein
MCIVSNVGDYFRENLPKQYPYIGPWTDPMPGIHSWPVAAPTKEEFDALKKQVEALKKLLEAAKIYDEVANEPDCSVDEKVEFIKRVADFVGVDLEDVFGTVHG